MTGRSVRPLCLAAAVCAFVLATAMPADAHVTVHSDDAVTGATDVVLTFRTPNERSDATTEELRVFLPTTTPLLGVLVQPIPGWRFTVRSVRLKHPINTDDGPITSAVSEVIWRGGAIPVGGYQDFDIDVGQLPHATSLTFKALQTYSDGTVVRWIETAPPGSPEPGHPAPVLRLTRPVHQTLASTSPSSASHDGRNLAIAALAVAVVALWVVVAGSLKRPRRR